MPASGRAAEAVVLHLSARVKSSVFADFFDRF